MRLKLIYAASQELLVPAAKTERAIDEGNVGLYKQVTFIYNQSQQIKRQLIYKSFASPPHPCDHALKLKS